MPELATAPACLCHEDADSFPVAVAPITPPARKPAMHATPAPVSFPTNPAAAALQSAAGMLAHCPGELDLSIRAGGYEITIRPAGGKPDRDNDAHPTATSATPAGAVASKPAAAGPSRNQLFEVLFSADERSILRALAAKQPSKASDVHDRCRSEVEKSKFWVLWSNLQHRNLVDDAPDDQSGFVIKSPWVAELVAEKPTKPATPA